MVTNSNYEDMDSFELAEIGQWISSVEGLDSITIGLSSIYEVLETLAFVMNRLEDEFSYIDANVDYVQCICRK